MKRYAGKKIVIVGAGRTGLALLGFFLREGARVTLSDRREAARIPEVEKMRQAGVGLDLGGHREEVFLDADLIAISPGVPLEQPAILAARQCGIPVWGEVEIAARALRAPLVAVTGTNGKSTVTTLLGEIFRAWERKTFVGGNLGVPLIDACRALDWQWIIAEISSFQLEAVEKFRPRHALLLNISEDHLDRYSTMSDYVAAKTNIFAAQTKEDWAILNHDDERVRQLAAACRARPVFFSSQGVLTAGMGFDGKHIVWRFKGSEERFAVQEMQLKGLHNVENAMAALIPPLLEGCPPQVAWHAVCGFSGLPHRMTLVRTLAGVNWYDDSKATNVGSVLKSLAGLAPPVTLIAGGKDKGGDYAPLRALVEEKVSHLILIGEAAGRMRQALEGAAQIKVATDMEDAVARAARVTPTGGTVLLSPACSSFDMFRDFEERGEIFTRLVQNLPDDAKVPVS